MQERPMPCSLIKLGRKDRETGHRATREGVSQSVATLGTLYTPRTGLFVTSRQSRGVRRV